MKRFMVGIFCAALIVSLAVPVQAATVLSSSADYSSNTLMQILVSVMIGAVVGGIVLGVMRGKMNTARSQRSATSYMKAGSYELKNRRDNFLYSQVSKIKKPDNNQSGRRK